MTLIKYLAIILIIVSTSTLVCGLWIKVNNVVDESSLYFHMIMGSISVVISIIMVITVMIVISKIN